MHIIQHALERLWTSSASLGSIKTRPREMLKDDNHRRKLRVHTHKCLYIYPKGSGKTIERLQNEVKKSLRKQNEKTKTLEDGRRRGRAWQEWEIRWQTQEEANVQTIMIPNRMSITNRREK